MKSLENVGTTGLEKVKREKKQFLLLSNNKVVGIQSSYSLQRCIDDNEEFANTPGNAIILKEVFDSFNQEQGKIY